MRVLAISTLYPLSPQSSFGRFVELSLDAAQASGEVDLVRVSPNGLPPWPLSRLIGQYRERAGLPARDQRFPGTNLYRPVFRLIPRMGARNPAAIARAVLPLARTLHAEKPFDLVDAQFFYPDGPAAMRIAKALSLPFSAKARGADIHHWSAQPGSREQVLETGSKAAGMLAVSQAMKDDMVALGFDPERIKVHYTGIDHKRFRPAHAPKADLRAELARQGFGFAPDAPLIVSVGALIPRKGQELVINALLDCPGVHYAMIGKGGEEARYRALAGEIGVEDRVHFCGAQPHDRIADLIRAADIAVLPSSSEGLANAWLEALACGTPLVASDVGGIRELLRDDSVGRIVERTPAAIASAINGLLAAPPDPQKIADSVAHFSWDHNGRVLIEHWRSLIRR
ncbi:MAG: glycosyltransferase [Blastomonas sp.]